MIRKNCMNCGKKFLFGKKCPRCGSEEVIR